MHLDSVTVNYFVLMMFDSIPTIHAEKKFAVKLSIIP